MTTTLNVTYDGEVFRPDEPLELEPNTRAQIIIETAKPIRKKSYAFLKTALAQNLQGPPDWSARLDEYLYGGTDHGHEK